MRFSRLVLALALALFCVTADAQQVVNQGSGSTTGYRPWRVTTTTATGAALDQLSQAYTSNGAPAARVATSTVSAAATGLTGGLVYRVACDSPVFYRTGTGTPTAVTTDSLFLAGVEYLGLRSTDTAFAFITAAGTGVCTITRLYSSP